MLNELNGKLLEIYDQLLETKEKVNEITSYNQELINIVNHLKSENKSLRIGLTNRQNYIDDLSNQIKTLKGGEK